MNMEMCRVCLSTEQQMFPLDETFITNYNLLTNLNITLLDGMPQYSCQTCLDTVTCFIEFRKKSIVAETTLREILYSDIKTQTKTIEVEVEELKNTSTCQNEKPGAIKSEIKEENCDGDDTKSLDNFDYEFSEYEEDDIIVKKEEEILMDCLRPGETEGCVRGHEQVPDKKTKKDKNEKKVKKLKLKTSKLLENIANGLDNEWLCDEKPKKDKNKKLKIKTSKLLGSIANRLEKKWFCGICPKKFDEKTDLNSHLDSHNKDRNCKLCREDTNSLSQLLAHRLMHIPSNQCKCHICGKKYKCCSYLEHHYRNFHIEGEERNLFCKQCPWTTSTPKKLNSHILQVHSDSRFVCDYCSKNCQSKASLKSHIKSHSINKTYVCDMCEFSCKHSGGLKDHIIRKHNPEKVYCKQCKRPFPNQLAHDKHKCTSLLRICPICGLKIDGSSRLSRHMESHSDVHRHECTKCPAKFKTRAALMAHLDRHDGNRTKQCEYCPAKFYTTTVLIKHRRIHTGEKPYVCKVCNKGFTGNHNLKVHMQVHGEYLIVKKNSEKEDLSKLYVTKST